MLAIRCEQAGSACGFQEGFSRLAFVAPAIKRVPTRPIGGAPASASRPFWPLLAQAFERFVDTGDLALSGSLKFENDRLGKPDIIHHFLLVVIFFEASNRALATGARPFTRWFVSW